MELPEAHGRAGTKPPHELRRSVYEGRENRALARSCENAQEIVKNELAERVGVLERDFAIPNVYSRLQLISRNRSVLASSNGCQRFRPFAGVRRFFYFNGTRNGTRRECVVKRLPKSLRGSFDVTLRRMIRMVIASGKVVDGRVDLDTELPEGASVTVLAREGDGTFQADAGDSGLLARQSRKPSPRLNRVSRVRFPPV